MRSVVATLGILPLTPENAEVWDRFCQKSSDAWFWHTSSYIRFTSKYKYQFRAKDLSFMICNSGDVDAICPLLLEAHDTPAGEVLEFSFGGAPIPVPALANALTEKTRRIRLESVFNHVDSLAKQHGVVRSSFRFVPLAPSFLKPQLPPHDYLMEFGYIPIPWNTQVIDLSPTLSQIHSGFRKAHKQSVKKAADVGVTIFDGGTMTEPVFDGFWDMYHEVSKLVHDKETRDLIMSWVSNNHGILAGAKIHDRFIGYAFVLTYKSQAYYMFACNDPEHIRGPIGHVIQWKVLEWLKLHGFRFYEIGYQFYHPLPYHLVSKKEMDISNFKLGFGGVTIPLYAGEKYYSKAYFSQVNSERAQRYRAHLEQTANP